MLAAVRVLLFLHIGMSYTVIVDLYSGFGVISNMTIQLLRRCRVVELSEVVKRLTKCGRKV